MNDRLSGQSTSLSLSFYVDLAVCLWNHWHLRVFVSPMWAWVRFPAAFLAIAYISLLCIRCSFRAASASLFFLVIQFFVIFFPLSHTHFSPVFSESLYLFSHLDTSLSLCRSLSLLSLSAWTSSSNFHFRLVFSMHFHRTHFLFPLSLTFFPSVASVSNKRTQWVTSHDLCVFRYRHFFVTFVFHRQR